MYRNLWGSDGPTWSGGITFDLGGITGGITWGQKYATWVYVAAGLLIGALLLSALKK